MPGKPDNALDGGTVLIRDALMIWLTEYDNPRITTFAATFSVAERPGAAGSSSAGASG